METEFEQYIYKLTLILDEVHRVLKKDGTLWLNLGDTYSVSGNGGHQAGTKFHGHSARKAEVLGRRRSGLRPKNLIGIPWRVALELQSRGWYVRSDIIWSKPNPMPESVKDRPTRAHEYIFLLSKSENYFYDHDAIKEPADPANNRTCELRIEVPGQTAHTGFINGRVYSSRNKRSVWTVATKPYPEAHFAVFPIELIEPCILAGSRPGDVVLDPFMGSGTTAQAAQHLGRDWLGCELNPEYVRLQSDRLRQSCIALG